MSKDINEVSSDDKGWKSKQGNGTESNRWAGGGSAPSAWLISEGLSLRGWHLNQG